MKRTLLAAAALLAMHGVGVAQIDKPAQYTCNDYLSDIRSIDNYQRAMDIAESLGATPSEHSKSMLEVTCEELDPNALLSVAIPKANIDTMKE